MLNLKLLGAVTVSRFALIAGEGARAPGINLSLSAIPLVGQGQFAVALCVRCVSMVTEISPEAGEVSPRNSNTDLSFRRRLTNQPASEVARCLVLIEGRRQLSAIEIFVVEPRSA